MNDKFEKLIERAEQLISRIESILPQPLQAPADWSAAIAWRYRRRSSGHGTLEPVRHVAQMPLDSLKEIDVQKEKIERNTRQFVEGKPANNVLLTGARGTGKSSLIRACLQAYAPQGLRLIEVDKAELIDLPDIVEVVSGRPEKFIVFSDDLPVPRAPVSNTLLAGLPSTNWRVLRSIFSFWTSISFSASSGICATWRTGSSVPWPELRRR